MSDEDAIRTIANQVTETWNRHAMTAFANLFEEDADFVNVFGAWWTSRSEIEAQHAAVHATVFRQSELRAAEVRIKLLCADAASLHIRWDLTGLLTPDGSALPARNGILVFVLVRRGDGWMIALAQNTDIVRPPS